MLFDNQKGVKMRQYETYKCQKCGNEVEVQNVGGGKLSCCSEETQCITTDLTALNLMKAFAGKSMARNKCIYLLTWPKKVDMQLLDILEKQPKMKNGTQEQNLKLTMKSLMVNL